MIALLSSVAPQAALGYKYCTLKKVDGPALNYLARGGIFSVGGVFMHDDDCGEHSLDLELGNIPPC